MKKALYCAIAAFVPVSCAAPALDRTHADAAAPPPWHLPAVPAADVPPVFTAEWERAENRATCAPLVPTDLGQPGSRATPRRAQFSGGWAVAYDLPDMRSAFGVAGTGAEPGPDTYDEWPHRLTWSDGSRVGYGPEGGTGPNQLAYLQVAGQQCLYNVWSRLGTEHLERLLAGLRRVAP